MISALDLLILDLRVNLAVLQTAMQIAESAALARARHQSQIALHTQFCRMLAVMSESTTAANPVPQPSPFESKCRPLRVEIDSLGKRVLRLKFDIQASPLVLPAEVDCGELYANLTLAYRHLEDARMRLGKAIQAYDGGVSCYDRDKNP